MRRTLRRHPDSPCDAVARIEVELLRPGPGRLRLRYVVTGRPEGLRLPAPAAPERADGLWQHTCFEAFLRPGPGAAYYEFNFAPSRCWAAYRFDGYRSGMAVADSVAAPRIETGAEGAGYELRAELALNQLPDLTGEGTWHLGLSAVIKETGGRTSYWALAHPSGRPDFHHSDCFTLEVSAANTKEC